MIDISDKELLDELKRRIEEKDRVMHDLRALTRRLEDLNRKLKDSEQMKSDFLANARNEINNPLTAILIPSYELLSCDKLEKSHIASLAGIVYREAFSLSFQMRNIFAAAEIEAGEMALSISRFDIGDIVLRVVNEHRQSALESNITVTFSVFPETGASFTSDPAKIQFILGNIFSNAIKFNSCGGSASIKASVGDHLLEVTVEDSGIGISEEDSKLLFVRFRQIETGMTKNHAGSGLGLSTSKAMAELLGGDITVTTGKERGTVITITIPEATSESGATTSEGGNEFFFEEEGNAEIL